jgi:hypothetical protein
MIWIQFIQLPEKSGVHKKSHWSTKTLGQFKKSICRFKHTFFNATCARTKKQLVIKSQPNIHAAKIGKVEEMAVGC